MMNRDAMIQTMRARIKAEGTIAEYAARHAIAVSTLQEALNGRRPLTAGVLARFGYERAERYRRADREA